MPISRALSQSGFICGLIIAFGSAPLHAQRRDTSTVVVRVVDSTGRVVRGADVDVRTRQGVTVAQARTDSSGRASLSIDVNASAEQILVRRLGFKPRTQSLPLPLENSVTVTVVLADFVQRLDTVQVDSRESIRRRIYYIDSATIAHSTRLIRDGWDVLKGLRPDIAYGRPLCPGVENVFINGRWIVPETVLINDMLLLREHMTSSATPHLAKTSGRVSPAGPRAAALSIMGMIKPEHIVEMTFRDCRDKPIAGMHSTSALFVILGPGIGFDPARGSFAIKEKR